MKKTIIILMLLFSVKAFAQTAALPVYACVQNGTQAVTSGLKSSNYQLGVVPYCSVSVYLTGTTTIATTTPQSPFRANKDGSIPPIYAAVNQGYDVVLSGGISPNTYSSPVPLIDMFPGFSFSGISRLIAGTNITLSPPGGTGNVTISATGGATEIEVNGVQVDDPPNFNDSTPAPASGYTSIKWQQSGSSVSAAVEIPSAASQIEMQVVPPVSGQYVIVYPTTYTGNWAGQSAVGGSWIDPPTCVGTSMGTESWGNPVLPSYVLPSNVTAVYAFALTREYVNPSNGNCFGQPTTPAPASFSVGASGTSSVLTPTSTPIWAPVQNAVLLPSVTGENFASQTFSASYGASTPIRTGSSGVVSLGWIVYYTGSAPPADTDIQVELPLYYNSVDNSLSISPLSEFPGSALVPTTVANLPWAAASNGWVVPVTDALTSTSCAIGGGFNYVQCKSDGSNWYPLPSSPVAFALTTTGTSGVATYQSGTLNIPQYTSSTVATFATGTSPMGITVDSSGNIWVANNASSTVREFTGGGAFIRDVSVGEPNSLAPDSSGNVWVVNGSYSNSVSKISSTGSVSSTYGTGDSTSGIALDSSGNIFVANAYAQTIIKRSPAWADLGDFSIPCQNEAVAIDATGNAWTRCRNGVTAYEVTTSGTVLGPFAIGPNANNDAGIAADSSGNVWFTNSGGASVTKLSSSGALVGTYPVGGGPIGIAIDSSTGNVFVANQNDNTVTELSSSGIHLNTFSVGAGPYGVAIDPSHNIWVTNYTGNTVSVISLQPPLTWPFQAGIPVYSGSGSWLSSLAPVNGACVVGAGGAWTAGSCAGSDSSPLTTKGDLYGYSTTNARIPVGTDGDVLTADSTQALGLKWAAGGGGSGTVNSGTAGQATYYGATGSTVSGTNSLPPSVATANSFSIQAAPYYASGSKASTTTSGSTTGGSTSITVASCNTGAFDATSASFQYGHQGIYIPGAGAAGAQYIGTVTTCSGTAMVVTPATTTTVSSGTLVLHDETAAWSSALATIAYGVTTNIQCPDGTYNVNGPFQNTSTSNGILLFPSLNYFSNPLVAPAQVSIIGNTIPAIGETTGCIIKSSQTTSTTSGAGFIGAIFSTYATDSGSPWGNQSNIDLRLENVVLRTYDNPQIIPLNGYYLANLHTNNIVEDTGFAPNCNYNPSYCSPDPTIPPTHSGAIGIVTPQLDNYGGVRLQNHYITGYYTGAQVQEHTILDWVWASWGVNCIVLNNGSGHMIEGYDVHCELDERDLSGSSSAFNIQLSNEPETSSSSLTTTIVYDPSNTLHGTVSYEDYYSGQSGFVTSTVKSGGTGVQVCNLNTLSGCSGSSSGVSSLNTQTGALTVTAGSGISVTTTSGNIAIANTGVAAWPPSAAVPVFSPAAGAVTSGTTVTDSCSTGTAYISCDGSTAVTGATGCSVTSGKTLYGECGGGEYLSTSSAAYTISGSAGTVTVVNSCSNIISTGTNTSNSCSITGVTAGDLIVLCGIADSGVSNSSLPMSDGTTSFTLTALQQSYDSGNPDTKYQDEQCGYLLSANPGNKTYTMTFADTVNNNYTSMFAVQLHSTVGTWHFDTSAGSSAASSTNSSLNTGNFTTTGATEAVIWDTDLDFITATVSSPLIGSTTPNEFSFSPIGNNHQYYMFNTSFSGQAGTLTYSTPTYWQTTILALKAY